MRFLPEWEQRFTVATAGSARNAHLTTGARRAPGRNLECARGPQEWLRMHTVSLGRKSLGVSAGRSLCGASWSRGRDRTAVGRKPLAALSRPLSAPAGLPRTAATAVRKSFRPTANSRTCGTSHPRPKNKIKPKYYAPANHRLEKTMEAEHFLSGKNPDDFYFALTLQRKRKRTFECQP